MEARFYTDGVDVLEARVRLETGHRENAVDFVEDILPDKEVQEQAAELQKDAIRNAQEAARRAEAHERDDLHQARKRQQGRGPGLSRGF
jgi:hypothetical protein